MTCEFSGWGRKCRQRALWVVMVGTRRYDAQLACGRHLNQTCEALANAEYPRTPLLSVRKFHEPQGRETDARPALVA